MNQSHHEIENFSFEGYLSGFLFIEGSKLTGKALSRAKLVTALNTMHKPSLGGIEIWYSSDDHTGTKDVLFLSVTKDGFVPLDTTSVVFQKK